MWHPHLTSPMQAPALLAFSLVIESITQLPRASLDFSGLVNPQFFLVWRFRQRLLGHILVALASQAYQNILLLSATTQNSVEFHPVAGTGDSTINSRDTSYWGESRSRLRSRSFTFLLLRLWKNSRGANFGPGAVRA